MEKGLTMEHKPYNATKAFHPIAGVYRRGVWCDTAKFMMWPTNYGHRAGSKMANRLNREMANRLNREMANRLNREYKKHMVVMAMARNAYNIGV